MHRPAVLKSLFAPASLSRLIEDEYGFADVRCDLIKATMRDTYLVRHAGGSAIACVYRSGARSLPEIESELTLSTHVAGQVTAPTAIPTRSGARIVALDAPEGRRYLTLISYIGGTMANRVAPPHLADNVGRALARFHLACDEIDVSLSRPRLDAGWLFDRQLPLIRAALGPRVPPVRILGGAAALAVDQVRCLPMASPGYGLIHGDVIPSNLLVTPAGGLALLDFDMSGYGWRAFDLATYLHELDFWEAPAVSHDALLSGYESVRSLEGWERESIDAFKVARALLGISIPAAHLDEWGTSTLPGKLVDRFVELAEQYGKRLAGS